MRNEEDEIPDSDPAAKKNKNNSEEVCSRVRFAKLKATKSLGRIVRRAEKYFLEERQLLNTAQPDQVIVPPTLTDPQREEAEAILKEAYARFYASYEKFIMDIASVRAAIHNAF